ncbi:MAG: carbohydrate-binding family 9-like protein [Bacteroidales bacterium]|nr:carbohydrate-binding family 9-like protein [Bacteroidales bacterium]
MKPNTKSLARLTCIFAVVIFVITNLSLYSQTEKQLVTGQQPVYKVSRAKEPITVDGKMDEASWQNAEVRAFEYFYRSDKEPEKQNTEFRMLWDNENLYLFYKCQDTSLTAREKEFDARPYMDDCAEFFCVPVPDSIYFHFGFELNIIKAAYDFVVLWRYYNNRTIFLRSYNPVYKTEVTYDGTLNDDTDKDKMWQMELAIPFSAFSDFHLVSRPKAGVRWAFQAVRQDRNFVSDRFRSTSTLFPIYDIRKDVHQPSRFGLLEFSD